MYHNFYLDDLTANSLKDYLTVLISTEQKSGYNVAKFSNKDSSNDPSSQKISNVKNAFFVFEILEISPYYVWLGAKVLSEGKEYKIAFKIKDKNFFGLIKESSIENGIMKLSSVIIFYRGSEVYLSPDNSSSNILKKALELKNESKEEILDEAPVPNNMYRTKSGLIALHLGTLKVDILISKVLLGIETKEFYVLSETKKNKVEDVTVSSIDCGKKKVLVKNPYTTKIGEHSLPIDFESIKNSIFSYETETQLAKFSDIKNIKSLIKPEIIHYIQTFKRDTIQNNRKKIAFEVLSFALNNRGKSISSFKGLDLGKALIAQLAYLNYCTNFKGKNLKDLSEKMIENLFTDESNENTLYLKYYNEGPIAFKLNGNNKDLIAKNSLEYYGSYQIKDNILYCEEKGYRELTVNCFLIDLLTMKEIRTY